jgi:hypothetical protein
MISKQGELYSPCDKLREYLNIPVWVSNGYSYTLFISAKLYLTTNLITGFGLGIQNVLLKALRKQNVPQAKGFQARRLYALL